MREFRSKLRVLLIDDNADHLRGVKELISMESNYDVVGATTSANIGINLVKKYHPDIVLMDINMPEKDGLQAIQEIEKLNLDTRIVALSGYDVSAVPFALAAEGACPAAVLKTNVIVPLYYEDGIEKDFFTACTIPAMSATRNGTVSGTAIALALALTSGNVYACGLDLAPAQGFQHTGPNALEAQDEAKDNRLRTKQTRIAASACNGGALTVYRDWFAAESERLAKRVFRLSDSYPFVHTLGKMRDVDWDFFTREHASAPSTTIFPRIVRTELPHTDRARVIRTCADACFAGDAYDAELCPVESLMQKRALTEHERAAYTETIARKKAQFVRELEQRI